MPNDSKFRLWEIGIPLRDAWLEFAPNDAKAKIKNMPGGWDKLNENLKILDNGTFASFVEAANDALATSRDKQDQIAELRELLLDKLFNSELIAVGNRLAPSRSRGLVQIPVDVFYDAVANWDDDSIEALAYRYERVRIVDPQCAIAVAIPRKKVGRVGSKAAIVNAIKELARDPKFKLLPRKTARARVKSHLISLGHKFDPDNPPEGAGLGNTNIDKLIVEICGTKNIKTESL